MRAKGFNEREALDFLNVKRSTYFSWLKRYKNSCGTQKMKTTELENKSRRPHNLRTSKIISPQLVSHILSIRQMQLMQENEYKYNCERMHQSLNYLTPMDYYYKLKENAA